MMSNFNINIVPPQLKSKFAPKKDQNLVISLDQKQQELVETDRSSTVDLAQVYGDERRSSSIIRPTIKIKPIFNNLYFGIASYSPFQNQLYYLDPEESFITNGSWTGYPQYKEFDFIREDINIEGYTANPNAHVNFVSESASSYNWSIYLSYASRNEENITLQYWGDSKNSIIHQWNARDGIPFTITGITVNGLRAYRFICPMEHGLSPDDSVELSFNYKGFNVFPVSSLGNGSFGSESYIFNIDDIGYTGTTIVDGTTGTFRKISNPSNSASTRSKYYVRVNKILTRSSDFIITKSGYELNGFNYQRRYEYSAITPNKVARVSEKEGNQNYVVTFKNDIDISDILDNQNRPITKLYTTIINKGYFGWLNPRIPNTNNSLKFGFEFNLSEDSNGWWDNNNSRSTETSITSSSYVRGSSTFFYNDDLNVDDEILGDFCEWNDFDQTERVISPIFHKMRFNQNVFQMQFPQINSNSDGYHYQVHFPITIREFSTYVETADTQRFNDIPNYSYFCQNENTFRWRDIYDYGFIDEQNVGVDYPFLNGAHYPYSDVTFRILPEGYFKYERKNILIFQPVTDECTTV